MRLVFSGPLIHTLDYRTIQILPRALLAVADGKIAWLIKDVVPPSPSDNTLHTAAAGKGWNLDASDSKLHKLQAGEFILPGFIDTHTHAPQYPNLGRGQDFELLDWLDNVTFPTESRFKDAAYAKRTYQSVVRRSLDSGVSLIRLTSAIAEPWSQTTTSCFFSTLHEEGTNILADACHKLGLRAFVGKVNMDSNAPAHYCEPSAVASVAATRSTVSHIQSLTAEPSTALVQPIITPRFAITCTSPLLKALGDLASEHKEIPIQTHISENPSEVAFAKVLFPESKSYTDIYERHGLLRENTILAHGCHLDSHLPEPGADDGPVSDSELELIKMRGAGLSHCPTSNINLRSGVARVGEWLDRGLKVALGTDVSGGYSLSMLSAIRHASFCSKLVAMDAAKKTLKPPSASNGDAIALDALLFLATLGGAQVCNIESKVGNFTEGKRFDALLVSTREDTGNPNMWVDPEELEEIALEGVACRS
ncbi:guanine deaminase [Auriculariales sp. MPI-PUGE-AT-0066]|nr:guanine deaminase [Auriculariales sp. MPI-PUGE-AT-0066]